MVHHTPAPPQQFFFDVGEDVEDAYWDDLYEEPLSLSGGARGPVTFGPNGVPLQITVYLALGADLTADPSTWILTNITQYVRYESGITCSSGRPDESSTVSPGSGGFMLDNSDGRFSRLNPSGAYYGQLSRNTPVLVEVNAGNGAYEMMTQYVNEWPVRFDKTLTNHYVPIKTGGVLRRLNQGTGTAYNAIRRAILGDANLIQYFPSEESASATSLSSAVNDTRGYMVGGFVAGSSTTTGTVSDPLPLTNFSAVVSNYMGGHSPVSTTNAWTTGALWYLTAAPGSLFHYVATVNGTIRFVAVNWDGSANLTLTLQDSSHATIATTSVAISSSQIQNAWIHLWISCEQIGTSVRYAIGYERTDPTTGVVTRAASSGTTAAQTCTFLRGANCYDGQIASGTAAIGHMYVLDRAQLSSTTFLDGAVSGWIGEAAADRVERVCGEEGVPFTRQYGAVPSGAMGAQPAASLIDIVRECEEVDGGVLYEKRWGLAFQPLAARYNMPVRLALDITRRHLSEEPELTDDDQALRNKWTITRYANSAESTAEDTASQSAEGVYSDSATLNLYTDDQCGQIAGWRVHVGTIDEYRWPSVNIRFDNAAGGALIPPWTQTEAFGTRFTITGMPSQVLGASEIVDLFHEGLTERVDKFTWTAEVNATPARAYSVVILDTESARMEGEDDLLLTGDITSTSTALGIGPNAVVAARGMDTNPVNYDLDIEGERVTLTSVINLGFSYQANVVRSVNGVVKAHSTGTVVKIWHPAVLAL